jgi:hypothetical protein
MRIEEKLKNMDSLELKKKEKLVQFYNLFLQKIDKKIGLNYSKNYILSNFEAITKIKNKTDFSFFFDKNNFNKNKIKF